MPRVPKLIAAPSVEYWAERISEFLEELEERIRPMFNREDMRKPFIKTYTAPNPTFNFMDVEDRIIFADSTAGQINVVLPDPAAANPTNDIAKGFEHIYYVKRIAGGSNVVVGTGAVGAPIDGGGNDTLSALYQAGRYVSDGTQYWKL